MEPPEESGEGLEGDADPDDKDGYVDPEKTVKKVPVRPGEGWERPEEGGLVLIRVHESVRQIFGAGAEVELCVNPYPHRCPPNPLRAECPPEWAHAIMSMSLLELARFEFPDGMAVLELIRLANERPVHPLDLIRCWVWNGPVDGNRRPDKIANVTVEYTVKDASTDTELLHQRQDAFIVDSSPYHRALALAAQEMRVGECAACIARDEFSEGMFGDRKVSAKKLRIDVKLVKLESVRPTHLEADAEKLSEARRRREEGNALFKSGDAEKAVRRYSRAVDFCLSLDNKDAELEGAIRNNLMACHLKLGEHLKVLKEADMLEKIQQLNAKAFYRRGCSEIALRRADTAVKTLTRAKELAPNDRAVLQALREAEVAVREAARDAKRIASRGLSGDVFGTERSNVMQKLV
jgi:tetratricopeptide (TPR) repeat protein